MLEKEMCIWLFLEREREKRVGCINFELFLRALAAAAPPILVMCCILSCRIWHQNRIIFEMRKLLLSQTTCSHVGIGARLTIIKLPE